MQGKWPDGGENPPHGEDLTPCMCALLHLELVLSFEFHLFDCFSFVSILYIIVFPN